MEEQRVSPFRPTGAEVKSCGVGLTFIHGGLQFAWFDRFEPYPVALWADLFFVGIMPFLAWCGVVVGALMLQRYSVKSSALALATATVVILTGAIFMLRVPQVQSSYPQLLPLLNGLLALKVVLAAAIIWLIGDLDLLMARIFGCDPPRKSVWTSRVFLAVWAIMVIVATFMGKDDGYFLLMFSTLMWTGAAFALMIGLLHVTNRVSKIMLAAKEAEPETSVR